MEYPLKAAGLLLLVALPAAHGVEFTGRFSMLGTTGVPGSGDIGDEPADGDALTADQQSARFMFDDVLNQAEWSAHLRTVRQHLSGFPAVRPHSSELFRRRRGGGTWLDESNADSITMVEYEFDRAVYRHRLERVTVGLGRQAIDWGSGRFWQPLNVFGAFAPTDLDTDYKPGIDALTVDAYPGPFSSLTAAYVLAPRDDPGIEDSRALHYRSQVGNLSELSLLAGSILDNRVVGTAFESAWGGMGWRVEGLHYAVGENDDESFFWIAGIDYQFTDGTLIAAEWYDNSRGATKESELRAIADDPLVAYGLQQQLGRHILGVLLQRDIHPLLKANYTFLAGALRDEENRSRASLLHQLNLTYSVSNESDLLVSLFYATGKGLDAGGEPRSEFGHLPPSLALRLRFYF